HWVALLGHPVEDARGSGRPGAGQKLDHTESCDAVARIFSPPQKCQQRRLKEFQTAEFYEWNVAPSYLHLGWGTVMRGAEQNSLRFECKPCLAVFQDLLDTMSDAFLRVRNLLNCPCYSPPSSRWPSICRPQRHSGLKCRKRYSYAPTR